MLLSKLIIAGNTTLAFSLYHIINKSQVSRLSCGGISAEVNWKMDEERDNNATHFGFILAFVWNGHISPELVQATVKTVGKSSLMY